MNKERLLRLADFLQIVPEEKFDLEEWTNVDTLEKMPELTGKTCESTACAVGWASAIPEFKEIGFHFELNEDQEYLIPVWGDHKNWDAVREFFGLSIGQAEKLFMYYNYAPGGNGPKDVAKAIRKFVKDNS